MPRRFNDTDIDQLLEEGLSINQTADRLGIPRTSLKRYLHERTHQQDRSPVDPRLPKSTLTPAIAVYPSQPVSTSPGPQHADEVYQLLPVLREMVREWVEHRQSTQVHLSQPKSTIRWTYHFDARWVQAVKDYAKLHRLSESAVANLALQQFFQSRQRESF